VAKIYYRTNGGINIPVALIWDSDASKRPAPPTSYIIADEGANDALLQDLAGTINKEDNEGNPKYTLVDDAGTWIIREYDGWEEWIE